jgi:hypothetical protein
VSTPEDPPGRPPGTDQPQVSETEEQFDEDPGDLGDDLGDDDLGPPINLGALSGLHTGPDLLERLRSRIERRQVTGDFARLFWSMPGALLRGLLWGMTPGQSPEIKDDSKRDDDG